MVMLLPPRQNDVPRLQDLVIIAIVTADASQATPLPHRTAKQTAATLTSIDFFESGFSPHAVGKLGEVGPWQLLGPGPACPNCPPVPKHLRGQVGEAIRRWRVQGPCGYTGEKLLELAGKPCPKAQRRIAKATWLIDHVPDVEPANDNEPIALR